MWLRGVTAAGLLSLCLTGCTGSPAAERSTEAEPSVSGLAGREPSADAPEFCSVLADADHVGTIPDAVGLLRVDPADPQPAWQLTQSSGELRNARDAVGDEPGHAELSAALDDLIDALGLAAAGSLDQAVSERIADGLAAVGRHAQPLCGFPT